MVTARPRVASRSSVALVIADVFAAGMGLLLCVSLLGDDALKPIALLGLPIVVAAGKAHGLHDHDELLINKTTIDQAPQPFQCATLYTLLVVVLQRFFIEGGLGSLQVLVLWGPLLFVAVLSRRGARWLARAITPVERCLFVGSDDSYERLQSKLPDEDRRANLVGRMAGRGSFYAAAGDPRRCPGEPIRPSHP